MEKQTVTVKGEFTEQYIRTLKGELSSMKSDNLIPYEITRFTPAKYTRNIFRLFALTLETPAEIELEFPINDGYVPLTTFMKENEKKLDVGQRMMMIGHLWKAFQSVMNLSVFSINHIRLLSLHPNNVQVKYDK